MFELSSSEVHGRFATLIWDNKPLHSRLHTLDDANSNGYHLGNAAQQSARQRVSSGKPCHSPRTGFTRFVC
jgi:hypothetical protein